eukprot:Skav229904  [mRNA]  locus=scaffold2151:480886:487552:+ [translate_table: standard]
MLDQHVFQHSQHTWLRPAKIRHHSLLLRLLLLLSQCPPPLLHAFAHIVVHESTLRIHQIELVINAGEDLCDGCGVGDHAAGAHHFGQVATRHHVGGW